MNEIRSKSYSLMMQDSIYAGQSSVRAGGADDEGQKEHNGSDVKREVDFIVH